jgi:hypothetical protein
MLGITTDKRFVSVTAARQAGKSLATSIFCTAVMLACPDVDIGLYASKLGQAGLIQSNVIENFKLLKRRIYICKAEGIHTRASIPHLPQKKASSHLPMAPPSNPPSAPIR